MCGCGVSEIDSDGDQIPDCCDGCPNDPHKVVPAACGCNCLEADDEGGDFDGDKVPNCRDRHRSGPPESVPKTRNANEYCPDCLDKCPYDPNHFVTLKCGCGVDEVDTDGDNQPDCVDLCPLDPKKIAPGICGCGVSDIDSDNDGTRDCFDKCPFDPLSTVPSPCGCGYDAFQCVEPRRSSGDPDKSGGISSLVAAVIAIIAVVGVTAVIIMVVGPIIIIRRRRAKAAMAGETNGSVEVDDASKWKRPTQWKNGSVTELAKEEVDATADQ